MVLSPRPPEDRPLGEVRTGLDCTPQPLVSWSSRDSGLGGKNFPEFGIRVEVTPGWTGPIKRHTIFRLEERWRFYQSSRLCPLRRCDPSDPYSFHPVRKEVEGRGREGGGRRSAVLSSRVVGTLRLGPRRSPGRAVSLFHSTRGVGTSVIRGEGQRYVSIFVNNLGRGFRGVSGRGRCIRRT